MLQKQHRRQSAPQPLQVSRTAISNAASVESVATAACDAVEKAAAVVRIAPLAEIKAARPEPNRLPLKTAANVAIGARATVAPSRRNVAVALGSVRKLRPNVRPHLNARHART